MVDLATALEWTLWRNPDLVAQRQNIEVSAEVLAVARHFPTSLNPTVSLDLRPWVLEPLPGGGANHLQSFVDVTWSQPIELGHRTSLRTSVAEASYSQTRFTVLQAELAALIRTYRLHQAALYRREKLAVARQLAEFNARLLEILQRQVEAIRATPADLVLARVESQSTRQQVAIASHEYVAALSELRSQLGIPEYAASAEPTGQFVMPSASSLADDEAMVCMALTSRPEILAAQAAAAGSQAAAALARADRIPIASAGPAYEKDESGKDFYGLVVSVPMPVLNTGRPLVLQREAEYHRDCVVLQQLRQRTETQTCAALVTWRDAQDLVDRTQVMVEPIREQTARMERLYAAGETDIIKLLQVRQRLLETENGQLDSIWAAIESYADLLTAVGAMPLIGSVTQP